MKARTDWDRLRVELEAERERLGLNMTEFSKQLHISQSLYSMFVRKARQRLGYDAMRAVCAYFNVQMDHWDLPPDPLREPCVLKLEKALLDPGIRSKRPDLVEAIEALIDVLYKAIPSRVGKALEPVEQTSGDK